MKVPLQYAAKEKMLTRIESDPNIQRETAISLPRMSFELTGLEYDSSRKLTTTGRIAVKDADNPSRLKYQYNPVPYNFKFNLSIYVKNAEDGTKIIEQILPFFTPDWTTSVNLIPEMDVKVDIPIVLDRVSVEDIYEGSFDKRKTLMWNLDFTLKGYVYGPIKKSAVIKFANTSFYIPDNNITDLTKAIGVSTADDRVTVSPGLDANGNPTSNAALTIDRSLIEADDDYGYITDIAGIIISE